MCGRKEDYKIYVDYFSEMIASSHNIQYHWIIYMFIFIVLTGLAGRIFAMEPSGLWRRFEDSNRPFRYLDARHRAVQYVRSRIDVKAFVVSFA